MNDRNLLKWTWRAFGWLIPALLSLILTVTTALFPRFTETVFSRGISHFLTTTFGWLVSKVPFSVTEAALIVLLGGLVLLFILVVFKTVWRALRHEEQPESHPLRILRVFGWILSCALLFHLCISGANSYRLPAEELYGLSVKRTPSAGEVFDLCVELADCANTERKVLETNVNGEALLCAPVAETLDRAGEGYARLSEEYPFLEHNVTRVKPVKLLSHKWSQLSGVYGAYFSLFAEPNINVDVPEIWIPFAAEHEMAHLRGIARENEANFTAALACFRHPSPDYRYAGYLASYLYCANMLYDMDHELWKEARSHCNAGVLKDLDAQAQYWAQIEGKQIDLPASSPMRYESAESSSKSYDRVVQLLCAYYEGGTRSLRYEE